MYIPDYLKLPTKLFTCNPAGDNAYARASRDAMRAYAIAIFDENPELATMLRKWVQVEQDNIQKYRTGTDVKIQAAD